MKNKIRITKGLLGIGLNLEPYALRSVGYREIDVIRKLYYSYIKNADQNCNLQHTIMMNVQATILTIKLDDLSEDSSTIISSKDELLHEFIDIDSVHDVFMYVTQCNIIKMLPTAG